jgi:hypothetical protein
VDWQDIISTATAISHCPITAAAAAAASCQVTVLDKTKMDWQGFKQTDAAVQEELEAHKRSDKQYLDRQVRRQLGWQPGLLLLFVACVMNGLCVLMCMACCGAFELCCAELTGRQARTHAVTSSTS